MPVAGAGVPRAVVKVGINVASIAVVTPAMTVVYVYGVGPFGSTVFVVPGAPTTPPPC